MFEIFQVHETIAFTSTLGLLLIDKFVMADHDKEEVTQHELLKKRSNLVHVIQDEHDYTKPSEVTQHSDHTLEEPEKPDRVM